MYCYVITLNWKNSELNSLHIIHKHNYAKIFIEKWQEGNSPDFNADSLWMVNDFAFFFQIFCMYKIYNRKKASIGPGTNSMGCLELQTWCQMLFFCFCFCFCFALKGQSFLWLKQFSQRDQLQHYSSVVSSWHTVLTCASLSENSCLWSAN